jgi:hypothetical protein
MVEFVTFLLAPIGYVGLTITAVQAARGPIPVTLLRAVTVIVLIHVLLVWIVRYDGQLSEATRNGYVGFALFHTTLLAIVASLFVGERLARRLLVAAFGIVTIGALGAVFRYDVVAMYRVPVILCAVLGSAGLVRAYHMRRAAPAA